MATFRKRPVEVQAHRLIGPQSIDTLEGVMMAGAGDWLITGVAGERYPCKDDIFRRTYEPVDEEARRLWGSRALRLDIPRRGG